MKNMGFAYVDVPSHNVDVTSNPNNDNLDHSLRRIAVLAEVAARGRRAARPHQGYVAHDTTRNTRDPRLHNNVSHRPIRLNSVGEESVNDDE